MPITDLMEGTKSVVRGCTDFFVLSSIEVEVAYGYAIMARIRKTTGVSLGASQVYPCLSRLEKEGFIKGVWEIDNGTRPKKVYTLTAKGRRLLRSQKELLKFISRI